MKTRHASHDRRHRAGPRFHGLGGAIRLLVIALVTSVALAPAAGATAHHRDQLAQTGHQVERLWLLGGLALSLTAAGVVAVAATRGRRNR